MKNRVILSGLIPIMWTDEHTTIINKFLTHPLQQILLLYIDLQNNRLVICETIPTFEVEEIAYFFRDESVNVTPDNFVKVIQFGTIHGSYVDGLLRMMHDLYAPTFFENQSWPVSILHLVINNSNYNTILKELSKILLP